MIIIKNKEQIEGIRKACKLAIDSLTHIEEFLKPNITTEEIDAKIEKYIRSHGGVPAPLGYKGYPKSTCVSINEVICHGIPSERALKEGDIVSIDVSTILNNYFGDTCKTYPIGEVSSKAKNLISITKNCLDIGMKEVKPNAPFNSIGNAIYNYVAYKGYGIVSQFGGHGTGLSLHEEPHIYHMRNSDTTKMKPGMIFTIEPMICEKSPNHILLEDGWTAITDDKGLSAQFEHTILVTDTGFEILTK